MQTAQTVMMVRPAAFRANPETMKSNHFQKSWDGDLDVASLARKAFDDYAASLRAEGVEVRIIDDISSQETPDSLFPNNWIVMLADGSIFTFPMEAHNRRRERRMDIIADLSHDYEVLRRVDLSRYEDKNLYLEGTGSLILDHDNRIAYACRSSRSSEVVGREFERLSGYRIHWFDARDRLHHPIYHTNVMMSIGTRFAIVCLESLSSESERRELISQLERTGKNLIDVTFAQMEAFSCNVLELRN
ncbi:arginine deiminase-related protein [Pantoea sp.]|uniref:arginine deiminase-related protein n=1 Tax=Pantoea sp. TaxID=69393 RepID=UPI0028AC1F3C|nr:arginine deiminase-related protein [Pantoea sp.]